MRQAKSFVEPNQNHRALFNIKSSGLVTIEPVVLRSSPECTLSALGIINVYLWWTFCNLFSKFSNNEVHLPKNMKIAHTANPQRFKHAIQNFSLNTAPVETAQTNINSVASKIRTCGNVKHQDPGQDNFSVVHYNLSESQIMKILRHTALQRDHSHRQTCDCRDKLQPFRSVLTTKRRFHPNTYKPPSNVRRSPWQKYCGITPYLAPWRRSKSRKFRPLPRWIED